MPTKRKKDDAGVLVTLTFEGEAFRELQIYASAILLLHPGSGFFCAKGVRYYRVYRQADLAHAQTMRVPAGELTPLTLHHLLEGGTPPG